MPRKKTTYRRKKKISIKGAYLRLFASVGSIVAILAIFYFFGLTILSNIDILWRFLKPGSSDYFTTSGDTTPPSPPHLYPLQPATKEPTINIGGFAEEGVEVKLYQNGGAVDSTLSDKDGQFAFDDITLQEGENEFSVKATDTNRNQSNSSNIIKITFDQSPPEIKITKPTERKIKSENRHQEIRGETELDVRVTIGGRQAVVNDEGEFSVTIRLEDGNNELEVKATDQAGNETTTTLTIEFEKED